MGRRGRHALQVVAWARLSRPVSCREMVAAVLRTGADRGEVKRRLAALGRWDGHTINEELRKAGVATAQRALKGATPEQRRLYVKIRAGGAGVAETLRELGL